MVFSMSACAKNNDNGNNSSSTATSSDAASQGYDIVDYKEYATLADYKGVEVTVDASALEVTEDEIQSEIDNALASYATDNQITEGTVKDGDTINLDFSGLLDGVAFSGGTATDVTYTVGGSNGSKYIDDLDRGLIGLEVGKEYEIPCTFPENYSSTNTELNGKDVIFVVTVNYIIEYTYPEFNDEFVQQLAKDQGIELSTTADMVQNIKDYLAASKLATVNNSKYSQVISKVIEDTQFKEMPESEYAYLQNLVRTNIQNEFDQYGSYFGSTDVESFYTDNMASMYGYSTLQEFIEGYSMQYLKEKMVITLIAEAENISVTDDEVKDYGTELATSNGYDSYDAIIEQYGSTIEEEFKYTLLQEKVFDFLVENAVEK